MRKGNWNFIGFLFICDPSVILCFVLCLQMLIQVWEEDPWRRKWMEWPFQDRLLERNQANLANGYKNDNCEEETEV